jgi:RNA polymerase sigma factor (sigma-70 family)
VERSGQANSSASRYGVAKQSRPTARLSGVDELERLYRDRYVGFRNALATVSGSYDTARDAVQEGFARAIEHRGDFRGGSLAAWVWRIALRAALDAQRRDRRSLTDLPDAVLLEAERDPILDEALRRLPPRRRLMVFLRYFADFSYEEIAEACSVRTGTVAAALAQARAELAEALRKEEAREREAAR